MERAAMDRIYSGVGAEGSAMLRLSCSIYWRWRVSRGGRKGSKMNAQYILLEASYTRRQSTAPRKSSILV